MISKLGGFKFYTVSHGREVLVTRLAIGFISGLNLVIHSFHILRSSQGFPGEKEYFSVII